MNAPAPRRAPAGWASAVGVLFVVAVVAVAAAVLPVGRWAGDLASYLRDAGAGGAAVFVITYVAATVLVVPGSLLTIGAGFAYGPVAGALLASPTSTLAATVSFLIARSAGRGWVSRRVARGGRFAAIDAAVGERGLTIVALLRMSPLLPYAVLNYVLGMTRVRLRDFVVGSWLGMLPGTVLYVSIGAALTRAADLASGEHAGAANWERALFWGGLAATLLVTIVVTRIARRALASALETGAAATTSEIRP